ncbi:hypothetical protein E2C01_065710 [Portunus trituberculatus]|uniref:Uncharacterized protein n=1 Tax=Portunus trituberculatus TaxID=210409 RepID=A0A5B7HMT9_PORTR|nr:hypothetical protein [Portunus trituberculatus]
MFRVRKPNLHSDPGQDSNPCAWRPLGPQNAHGSTVPRRESTTNLTKYRVLCRMSLAVGPHPYLYHRPSNINAQLTKL